MAGYSFDAGLDAQEETSKNGPQTPFWTLDFTDEEKVLAWLNAEISYLKDQAQERILNQRKNLAIYRGIQFQTSDRNARDETANHNAVSKRSKNPRVVYNHMVDMVEQHVSRMTKYRGAVSCDPGSDDSEDRIVAEIAEDMVEGFWQKSDVDIDYLMQRHVRRMRIFGEDFVGVYWDRNLGPYDLDWVRKVFQESGVGEDPAKMPPAKLYAQLRKIREAGGFPRLPLVDPETGNQLKSQLGEPLWIDRPVRAGDVKYRLHFSWDVFGQRRADWEDSEYGFWREYIPIETIKAQHPSKAHKIEADSHQGVWDADLCEETTRKSDLEVWHFYHRSTAELDAGRYIKFVRSAALINKDNPYLGDDYRAIIPLIRSGDIDTPGVMNGDSTVTHGRGPQAVYNNLVSLDIRNKFQFAHPKWFMPKGAAKVESLGNNTTVVSYRGPNPPKVSQPQIQSDTEGKTEAKTDLQQIMGVYGVSRGEPPTGVTAAVALTFLDEQENERSNVGVAAVTRSLLNIAKHTIWLMSDFYDDSKERLERILGRNRAADIDNFNMVDLRSIADVKVKNASALPQQKSARIQYILDIKKEFPGIVPEDHAVELLGLGEVDRLRSIVSVAIRAAESENQKLMMGKVPKEPRDFEYHLQHYRIHMRQMNEDSYETLPEESQQNFKDHMSAHEMYMVQISTRNPQYGMMIAQEFPGFPYFFVPEEAPVEEMPPVDLGMPPEAMMGAPVEQPPSMMPEGQGMAPADDLSTPALEGIAPGAEAITPV